MGEKIVRHTGNKCRVCEGEIVEEVWTKSKSINGDPIKGDWVDVIKDIYCKKCGLRYKFPPPEKDRESYDKK